MAEFDRYAEHYDDLLRDPVRDRFAASGFFHERKWLLLEQWFARHPLPRDPAWLDVGCGRGELLDLGRHRFARAEGCDPAEEMLRHSRHNVRLQTSPTRLPYRDAEFDFLTAVCIYHHVKEADRPALTADLLRVLRPGGVACIMEHNPWNPVTRLIVSRTPVDADAHLLSSLQTYRYLRAAGFLRPDTEHFLFFPEGVYRRAGAIENILRWLPLGGQYATFARKA